MAQADQTVQNDTFPTVRADINNNLAALFSNSSGVPQPSSTVAFQDWIDLGTTIDPTSTSPVWRKRNSNNNAWIKVATIVGNTITFEGTLPSQTSQSGKYLTTNGTVASWGAIPPGSSKEVFTANGTWVKPTAGTIALITLWGGGGSGARFGSSAAGGGGGGACVQRLFQLSDLPGSAAVTIGAGGAAIGSTTDANGNVGGTSSFGSLMSAYGGAGGSRTSAGGTPLANGGGGGGSLAAGSSSTGGAGHGSTLTGGNAGDKGDYGGAGGGTGTLSPVGATAFWGGGGGGGANNGSATQRAGGDSLNGGDGATSNTGTTASVPGGGGGSSNQTAVASGAGGAGLCIVYIW
jgi:hypothetical protein